MTKKIPFKNFLTEIKNLILRFPLSSFFLLAMTIRELYTDKNLLTGNYLNSILIFGVLISSISQMIYERFYLKNCKKRRLLYLGSLILLGLYAFYTKSSLSIIDGEIYQFYSIPGIREMILSFTLVIAFIWIPTIKQKEIKFSDSFIVSFRALFTSQFFSLILLIGVSSIILLIESLLFSVGPNWLSNMLTIIFNLIGPLIFLSLIPRYYLIQSDSPKKVKTLRSLIDPSKFLSQLVSYILIPLMVAFSGILILYILRNFGSGFFTESAIESLLLNYIVYGWILLLLSDSVQSELVQIFKKFFPYALIFVVFLQMIATFNQIQIFGITHGRYFILSLGLASLLGALWYLIRKEDLRILPVLAILTGLISLVPPIDAMSVSVRNQLGRIENVLEEENINPEDSNVRAGDSFSTGQKQKIKDSLNYLEDIQALNKLSWLPEEYYPNPIDYFDLDESSDSAINDLWGDDEDKPDDNQEEKKEENQSDIYLDIDPLEIDLKDYSRLFELNFYSTMPGAAENFELDGQNYSYYLELENGLKIILDSDEFEEELVFDFSYILDDFEGMGKQDLPIEELTFTEEKEGYRLEIIIQHLEMDDDILSVSLYLLV